MGFDWDIGIEGVESEGEIDAVNHVFAGAVGAHSFGGDVAHVETLGENDVSRADAWPGCHHVSAKVEI